MIGRIYKIIPKCQECETGDVYFGATTRETLIRFREHRRKYNEYKNGKYTYTSSFLLFDKYGRDNCDVEELEMVEYNDLLELRKRENEYIKNNDCVNKRDSVIDMDKRKKDRKIWNKRWFNVKNTCDCGGRYTNKHKSQHLKSGKHRRYLETME